MKKILILFFVFFSQSLFAQTVTVSEDVSIRNDKFYAIIGKMKGRLLLLRDRSNKVEVQAFDEKLRKGWDKELTLDKKNADVLEVISGKEYFSLLYRFKHKGKVYVKLHRYDPAANLVDSMTVYNFGNSMITPNLEVVYSESRNIAVVFKLDSQREFEAFAVRLDEPEVLWERKFSAQDFNAYRDDFTTIATNVGDAHFLFEIENRSGKQENHKLDVYTLSPENKNAQRFEIGLQEFLTYDVEYVYDNLNRALVASGLYTEKNKSKAKGYFFLRIPNMDPNRIVLSKEEFQDEFLSNLLQKEIKNNKGISDVEVREIVLRRDGGLLVVVERSREYERHSAYAGRTFSGGATGRFIVDYYHDDVFAVSFHPNGETHWQNIMYKRQYAQDDDAVFSSFFLLKTPSSLRFLFNDDIKEENTVSEYVVFANGKMDRNSVLSTDDQDIRLRFRDALQTDANELIVPSERRNRLRLVRVEFN